MRFLRHLTWKYMIANRTRTIVTIVSVLLAAALFCVVTTLAISIRSYLIDLQIHYGGDYYVKCHQTSQEAAQKIRMDEDIEVVAESKVLGIVNLKEEESGMYSGLLSACNDCYFAMMPVYLKEGRLPQNSGEVLISYYWQIILPEYGIDANVGNTIPLDVLPYIESTGAGIPDAELITKNYTIVGVLAEEFTYETFYSGSNLQMIYTYDDGVRDEIYSDFYLKSVRPYDAYQIADRYNGTSNEMLLSYLGVAKSTADQYILLGSSLLFIIIIMIGSSGLIHNSFSISFSQRLKEYGILSGVGATAKQIRNSIRYEAWMICLLGVPAGLLLGCGGTLLSVKYVGKVIQGMIPLSSPRITLTAKFHPFALIMAAFISILTVFWSANKTIRMSSKLSPISVVRQTHEYSHSKKWQKHCKSFEKAKNISSAIAQKYYAVNHSKFKRVIISLVMSIVIFMLAATVSESFNDFADAKIREENYDFLVIHPGEDQVLLEAATSHQSIERKAGYTSVSGQLVVSESDYSMEKLEADAIIHDYYPTSNRGQVITIYYLENSVLKEYLEDHDIDPAPYLRSESPLALVCQKKLSTPRIKTADGNYVQHNIDFFPISEKTTQITVYGSDVPVEIRDYYTRMYSTDKIVIAGRYVKNENDEIIYEVQVSALIGSGMDANLKTVGSHRLLVNYNVNKKQMQFHEIVDNVASKIPVATSSSASFELQLGARIEEMPFGIPNDVDPYSTLSVILPLSSTDKKIRAVAIQTQDYLSTVKYLTSFSEENVVFSDSMAEAFQSRSTAQMINLFSNAYLIFITTLCAANIFNTVSTSLVSRKRDYGILKSLGMTQIQLQRTLMYEYCKCGIRSVLVGVPIGALLCTILRVLLSELQDIDFSIPIKAVLFCIISVAVAVGTSLIYALYVVKKQSPIQSIRENAF